MKFSYTLNGVSVVIDVYHYRAPCPMRITGTGFGDAVAPEEEEFEFSILGEDCLPYHDVEFSPSDEAKLLAYYKKLRGLKCP